MIAIDTSLLVYAHRRAVPEHRRARRAIERAAASTAGWGISLPTLCEFWSIATHPRAAAQPSTALRAAAFIRALVKAEMRIWTPAADFAERLVKHAVDLSIRGARVFDLQIVLIAVDNGAHEIWTHDANFVRLRGVAVHDPL